MCFNWRWGQMEGSSRISSPEAKCPSLGRSTQSRSSWQAESPWEPWFHHDGGYLFFSWWISIKPWKMEPSLFLHLSCCLKAARQLETPGWFHKTYASKIYRDRRRHNLLVASVGGDEKNVSAKLDVVRVALAWKCKKYSLLFSEDDPRLNHGVVLYNVEKNKKRCSIKGQIEA